MSGDAVAVAPQMYKVVLENDRVRVLEAAGKPGDKSDMHAHPAGVSITLASATVRVTLRDGETRDVDFAPNAVRYMEPTEHAGEILGPGELRVLIVELK